MTMGQVPRDIPDARGETEDSRDTHRMHSSSRNVLPVPVPGLSSDQRTGPESTGEGGGVSRKVITSSLAESRSVPAEPFSTQGPRLEDRNRRSVAPLVRVSSSVNRHASDLDKRERHGQNDRQSEIIQHRATVPSFAKPSSRVSSQAATDSDASVIIEEVRKSADGRTKISVHRYLRGKLLGKGGFAKVYMCTSLDTQKSYAIKIVPKANLVKTRARQKLQAEIKIHRTLKHPYICEYKHFFEDRKNCYILLELCDNQSMNELLRRRKRLTEEEVVYYFLQLIDGTMYMHSNNVIHRDLKLGNLFLNRTLEVKIGDLGLATKLSNAEDRRKTICGTPNYIAPEIIDGNKGGNGHSFEVDIWSMGVILFTLLVGKPPYESKDVKSTYQRILKNEYFYPNHVSVSQNAKDLISACLQTKPDMRPSLAEVRSHPFFDGTTIKVPKFLPSRCTHMEPIWQENSNGHIVATFKDEGAGSLSTGRRKKHEGALHSMGHHHVRKPLSTRDRNQLEHSEVNPKDAKKAFPRNNKVQSHKPPCQGNAVDNELICQEVGGQKAVMFKVFDDSRNRRGDGGTEAREQPTQPQIVEPNQVRRVQTPTIDELTSKASMLSLGDRPQPPMNPSKDTPVPERLPNTVDNPHGPEVIPSSYPPHMQQKPSLASHSDRDVASLEIMHVSLAQCIEQMERKSTQTLEQLAPKALTLSCETEEKWVTRYVDYTSKYGLGFLLNDGSAGVYFNDSTKAVLTPKGDEFFYVERRRSQRADVANQQRQSEPLCDVHSLSNYPETLQKKVTLLKHFCGYLVEQEKKAETDLPTSAGKTNADGASSSVNSEDFVYLKKWVRTRHAILFRLSNCTIQVVFFDHTEVLISPEAHFITYVDKARSRTTFHINTLVSDPSAEITKRLRYAKDILNQLISG